MITVAQANPLAKDAAGLLDELSDVLARITGSSGRNSFDPEDVMQRGSLFVIAREESGRAVGCGAFRAHETGICEIKRMYARPGTKGVGEAILTHLERNARTSGYNRSVAETRVVNERAVRFYLEHGYRQIPNFGKYAGRPEAICFGKALV